LVLATAWLPVNSAVSR